MRVAPSAWLMHSRESVLCMSGSVEGCYAWLKFCFLACNLFPKHMHEPQASRTNALWHITFAEICKFIEICLDALGMSVIAYIDVESREVKLSHALTRDICKLACHITATIPTNLIKLIKINK